MIRHERGDPIAVQIIKIDELPHVHVDTYTSAPIPPPSESLLFLRCPPYYGNSSTRHPGDAPKSTPLPLLSFSIQKGRPPGTPFGRQLAHRYEHGKDPSSNWMVS